jgi:hypothetical protein
MRKIEVNEIEKALASEYFAHLEPFTNEKESAKDAILRILDTPYETLNAKEKDAFFAWHKFRVFELENVKNIIPKNVETHVLVTALGHVCIIRRPIGRVLGQVIGKLSNTKEPSYYEAGSIILQECRIFMEKPIEANPDEHFSVIMSCVGSIQMIETAIKKNY